MVVVTMALTILQCHLIYILWFDEKIMWKGKGVEAWDVGERRGDGFLHLLALRGTRKRVRQ